MTGFRFDARPLLRVAAIATTAALPFLPTTLSAQDPLGAPVPDEERDERCFCVGEQAGLRPSLMLPMGMGRAQLGLFLGQAVEVEGRWGVRVEDVMEGGPAARAGIAAGDVLVAVDRDDLGRNAPAALQRRIRSAEPGDTVELTVIREGRDRQVQVVLEELSGARYRFNSQMRGAHAPDAPRPPAIMRWRQGDADAPPLPPRLRGLARGDLESLMPSRLELRRAGPLRLRHGLELVPVSPELGRYFGVDRGVLVAEAAEDAPFDLQAGDVIVAIGDREVRTPEHALSILRSYLPDEEVELRVVRDRDTITARGTTGR